MNVNRQTQHPRRKQYPEIATLGERQKITDELKSARDFHEMSLEQISATTKINIPYLENIEDGHWSFLPPVYIKLFIKSYGNMVGIQSEEFTKRLDDLFDMIKPRIPIHHVKDESEQKEEQETVESHSLPSVTLPAWVERNRSLLFYGSITVVILALIIYYLSRPPGETPPPVTRLETELPVTPILEDTSRVVSVSDTVSSVIDEDVEEPLVETFHPTFYFIDDCYMKITYRDSTLHEPTLWGGNRYGVELPYPVKIVFGNAEAVRIIIEGDTLPTFPEGTKVRTVRLGPEGIIR